MYDSRSRQPEADKETNVAGRRRKIRASIEEENKERLNLNRKGKSRNMLSALVLSGREQ